MEFMVDIWIYPLNQTWLAGKSSMNVGLNRNITHFYGPFSSTPRLITGGYPLVKTNIAIEHGLVTDDLPNLRLVIFHSHVSLPEGSFK